MSPPAACGGAVQADTTPVTPGALARYWCDVRARGAGGRPCTPSGAVTMKINCTSDCPNFSASSCVAREDSDDGILKPACRQALGHRHSEHAGDEHQQRGDGEDPARRGDGQHGDPVQHDRPPSRGCPGDGLFHVMHSAPTAVRLGAMVPTAAPGSRPSADPSTAYLSSVSSAEFRVGGRPSLPGSSSRPSWRELFWAPAARSPRRACRRTRTWAGRWQFATGSRTL